VRLVNAVIHTCKKPDILKVVHLGKPSGVGRAAFKSLQIRQLMGTRRLPPELGIQIEPRRNLQAPETDHSCQYQSPLYGIDVDVATFKDEVLDLQFERDTISSVKLR
jgi:hypothetical protein